MDELQSRWADGQLLGLDVMGHASGALQWISIDSYRNEQLAHAFYKEYRLAYEGVTTLGELLGQHPDPWSQIQVNQRLVLGDGQVLWCGEGEMGNEGFIARTDANNRLQWFLYSTTSNPFTQITQEQDRLYIRSSHCFCIALNLLDNAVQVVNHDVFASSER